LTPLLVRIFLFLFATTNLSPWYLGTHLSDRPNFPEFSPASPRWCF